MTQEQKLASLRLKLNNPQESDETLLDILNDAQERILNKIYEVVNRPSDATLPSKYDSLQVMLAVEMYNKRGAEGESTHNENGINRTYMGYDVLLRQVKSKVGSVYRENTGT